MKTFRLIAALAASLLCLTVNAQTVREEFPSYIEVNGYAEKEVAPDVFYVRVVINEQDSNGRKSLDSWNDAMLKALKSCGVDTEKQLTRLSLTSTFYKKKTNLSSATYQLKLNSAEQVSMVWRVLDNIGISNVSFTRAEKSQIESVKDEVRREAVLNARAQAAGMAEAIGQSIGKCFYISGGYSGTPVVYAQPRMAKISMMDSAANGVMEEAEADGIEFENIRVSISVSAKFVLN